MALPLSDAAMLLAMSEKMIRKEVVVCLGEPLMSYTLQDVFSFCRKAGVAFNEQSSEPLSGKLTAKSFFSWLGFEQCITLDISDYEGAHIVHNLNEDTLDERFHDLADLIIDAGTLEHVFHIPNALNTIFKLLRVNGMIYHHNPANGYLDHGFYQFSPTLFYDYYRENQYELVSANLINRYNGVVTSEPYVTDIYRNKGMYYAIENLERATLAFLVRKKVNTTSGQVPTQTFYRQMHTDFEQTYEQEQPHKFKYNTLAGKMRFYFPGLTNWLIKKRKK